MAELKHELRLEIAKLNGGPGVIDFDYEKPTKVSSSPLKNPPKLTKNQKPTKHNQKKPKSHTKEKKPKKTKTHKPPKKSKKGTNSGKVNVSDCFDSDSDSDTITIVNENKAESSNTGKIIGAGAVAVGGAAIIGGIIHHKNNNSDSDSETGSSETEDSSDDSSDGGSSLNDERNTDQGKTESEPEGQEPPALFGSGSGLFGTGMFNTSGDSKPIG